ncbi:ACT domain-containing protein [Octadecabacter temperatus]|nr:ACT domain-containing protein [Octadecabacter temperatus]
MKLTFTLLSGDYAITRLPADAPIPAWIDQTGLVSITRADDELSIVCLSSGTPTEADTGWSALRVDMLAALDEPGVVMSAVTPISSAGLGVFVISTHLRDYLLVRTTELSRVRTVLTQAGNTIA